MSFDSIYTYLGDFPNVHHDDTSCSHAGERNHLAYCATYIVLQNLFISRNRSERYVRRSSHDPAKKFVHEFPWYGREK